MSGPVLADHGPAAPPRLNGELVFDAPWQSRVFGVTAALADADALSWSDFQAALIERVGQADLDTGTPDGYWSCWLDALGALTGSAGHVTSDNWSARAEAFAAREPGHDHDHEHEPGHDHSH